MRMPRNISGAELASLLGRRYRYVLIRQRGSHMRLESDYMGYSHRISVPHHAPMRTGTLNRILNDVAEYLEVEREELTRELFGR